MTETTSPEDGARDDSSPSTPASTSSRNTFIAFGMGLALPAMFIGGFFAGAAYNSGGSDSAAPVPVPTADPVPGPTDTGAPVEESPVIPVADPTLDIPLPAGVVAAGAPYVFGNDDAPVTITIVEDMTCPFCANFEQQTQAATDQAVADGTIRVQRFVGALFGPGAYVGANAVACAADQDAMGPVSALLYATQPADHAAWSNKELQKIAEDPASGISDVDAFMSCVKDDTYRDYVDSVTGAAADARIPGTPSIFVDQQFVDPAEMTPDAYIKFVESITIQ